MRFVGSIVVFDLRFHVSGALDAGVGTDCLESVSDAALFLDIRGSGVEWYSVDLFVAELHGIGCFPVFAFVCFAEAEAGFVGV